MSDEILQAIETLVSHNCLTVAEALDKAFAAGHRKAVKELEKPELALVTNVGLQKTARE